MTVKAPRRPHRLGRTATQLTDVRRPHRQLPGPRTDAAGRLTARWVQGADGRLVLEWTLEQQTRRLADRKRGTNA
jgi:hypothetical protein